MRGMKILRWAPVFAGLLGFAAIAGAASRADAVSVTACADYSTDTNTRYDIDTNISTTITTGTCLKFHRGAVVYLNGYTISGATADNYPQSTIGIEMGLDGFVWGPGNIKRFSIGIKGGDHVAVENVMIGPVHIGIQLGDSYKVKEVRIRNCATSGGGDIGIDTASGGFMESNIIRDCLIGVHTLTNNKLWNLVITKSFTAGLLLGNLATIPYPSTVVANSGTGNAVSRTVISSPKSTSTTGADYRGCGTSSTSGGGGCQDGSNSYQEHGCGSGTGATACTPGLNLLVNTPGINTGSIVSVITDGHTNCGGIPVPFIGANDLILNNC